MVLYAGSGGKALLAFGAEALRSEVLKRDNLKKHRQDGRTCGGWGKSWKRFDGEGTRQVLASGMQRWHRWRLPSTTQMARSALR